MTNDLALVLLDSDVNWSPHVSPVCLASPTDDYDYAEGSVSGFGLVQFDEDHPEGNH